ATALGASLALGPRGAGAGPGVQAASARELTFEERVRAQEAIERVVWLHRAWPKENPRPKPPLAEVLPDEAIRAKVQRSMGASAALAIAWSRAILPADLQAEIDRMVRDSKDSALLGELFAALGDDPFLIAECLARPALADRRARELYAFDARMHGALRRR